MLERYRRSSSARGIAFGGGASSWHWLAIFLVAADMAITSVAGGSKSTTQRDAGRSREPYSGSPSDAGGLRPASRFASLERVNRFPDVKQGALGIGDACVVKMARRTAFQHRQSAALVPENRLATLVSRPCRTRRRVPCLKAWAGGRRGV